LRWRNSPCLAPGIAVKSGIAASFTRAENFMSHRYFFYFYFWNYLAPRRAK
jgi:hypothetical protein